jgi:hypothetical protein
MEQVIEKKKSKINLPLGQRILKSKFKKITHETLRERFACDKITDKFKEKAMQEAKTFAKKWGGFKKYWTFEDDHACNCIWAKYNNFFTMGHCFESFRYEVCDVTFVPLEKYAEDIIPYRCLESVEEARKLGISEFNVAFPEIGRDPIIIGYVGKTMFEIDMWE